jgi:environmental stress-induced protein Ves
MAALQPVPVAEFREQPWANGHGRTAELAAGPDRENWRWRLSLATVDGDGAFSILPGVRRLLAPLDGDMELTFEDASTLKARRLQVIAFDGARACTCHLPDGTGRDFNLMLRDGADGELILRPLVGSMIWLPRPGMRWFAYLLAGHAHLSAGREHLPLETGHAAWIEPPTGTRILLEGAGEIALVRLGASR